MADNMGRALNWITLYVWIALLQLYIGTRFSTAALSEHVGMKITNDYTSGKYTNHYFQVMILTACNELD